MTKLMIVIFIFLTSCVDHSDYSNYYYDNEKELNELANRIYKSPYNEFLLATKSRSGDFTNDLNLKRIVILSKELKVDGFEKFPGFILLKKSGTDLTGLAYVTETCQSEKVLFGKPLIFKKINNKWYTVGWK